MEIAEPYRPQPGRPPVDAAISGTVKRLDEARSRLNRTQRANQPMELELARIESISHQLAFLQTLHKLEQSIWLKLHATAQLEEPLSPLEKPAEVCPLISASTRDWPQIAPPLPAQWANVPTQDFANPDLWLQIGQLKNRFVISRERSFRRLVAHLKSLGLRTLPAHQDARIRLCYRPDIDHFTEMLAKKSRLGGHSSIQQQPSPISRDQMTEIWQAIRKLQSQQRIIIDAINKLSAVPIITTEFD